MKYDGYLSESGKVIYDAIYKHCCDKLKIMEVDHFELQMLANAFDLYQRNAKICNEKGTTQKPSDGGWDQVRPEYTVMKNEYQIILKHSGKFGLNPGDRAKFFKGIEP